ncbi:hypothetical protein EC991_008955 [Linnemannia zychae]|nr:hypothetical protein EC991_008955 [Linnemannia zychae]
MLCRSFKEKFKSSQGDKYGKHQPLIGKHAFLGDPDQAHWTSDFDHIASEHATIDTKKQQLVLKAKRDKVKVKSGGGFGATVSSTRWNRYGTFATQFRAGSTGPGIVTAFILSNPALGEEISFQITGRDPNIVLTEYYKHPTSMEEGQGSTDGQGGSGSSGGAGWMSTSVPDLLHWPSLPSTPIESIMTRGRKLKDLLLHKSHEDNIVQQGRNPEDINTIQDHSESEDEYDSLEESHKLKKSTTENDHVYKIEWTPTKIEWSVNGKVLRTLRSKDLANIKKTTSQSGQQRQRQLEIPSQPMQIQLVIWDAGHNKETTAWAGGVTDYGENDEREYVARVDWIEIACYDNKEAKRNPWPGKDASARLAQVEAEERKAEEEKEARLKAEEKNDKDKKNKKDKSDKKAQKVLDATIAAKDAASSGGLGSWFPFGRRGNGSADLTTTTTSKADNTKPKSKKQLKQEEKQRKKQKQAAEKLKEKEKKARAKEPGVMSRFLDTLIRRLVRLNFVVLFLVAVGTYLTEPVNSRKFHIMSKEKAGLQQ